MQKRSYAQDVAAKVLEQLQDGVKPWEKTWGSSATKAFNPFTREEGTAGRAYRGGNALNLMLEQIERDSSDPRWMTFNQAKFAGLSVAKGAKAATVVYWQFPQEDDSPLGQAVAEVRKALGRGVNDDEAKLVATEVLVDAGADADRVAELASDAVERAHKPDRPRPIYASVFNGADVIGLPPMKDRPRFDASERAEQLICSADVELQLGSDGEPHARSVRVQAKETFNKESDYYRQVFYEMGLWSCKDEQLNLNVESIRQILRADMASSIVCRKLGFVDDSLPNKDLLAWYIDLLEADPNEVLRASRDAEKIADFVLDFDAELRAELDAPLRDNTVSKPTEQEKKLKQALTQIIKAPVPTFAPVKPAPVPVTPTAERVAQENPQFSADDVQAVADLRGALLAKHAADEDVEIEFGDLHEDSDDISIDASDLVAPDVADDDDLFEHMGR